MQDWSRLWLFATWQRSTSARSGMPAYGGSRISQLTARHEQRAYTLPSPAVSAPAAATRRPGGTGGGL